NQADLDRLDLDTGSGGLLLLPDAVGSIDHPHLAITSCKDGRIFLIDRDNMGRYDPTDPTPAGDHIVQEIAGQLRQGLVMTPSYYNGRVYFSTTGEPIKGYSIRNGLLSVTPATQTLDTFARPGAMPVISAFGTSDGIVWGTELGSNTLRAY